MYVHREPKIFKNHFHCKAMLLDILSQVLSFKYKILYNSHTLPHKNTI